MTLAMNRRAFLLSGAAAGAVIASGCAHGVGAGGSTGAQARALYDGIFQNMLRASPELATGLGLDTGELASLRGQLSSSSPAGRLGPLAPLAEQLPALKALDRTALLPQEQAWLDTAIWAGERVGESESFPYGGHTGYPIPYVVSQLTGSYQSVPDFLDSQHPIETRADAEAYLSRLQAFGRNIDQEVERARADAGRGVVPPAYILDKAMTQTRNLRDERGAEAGLVRSLVRRTGEKNIAGDWGRQAQALVDGPIAQALDRQLALLQELRRTAGTAAGVNRLPDGERFYGLALRYHTSTSLTPDQAHEIGLRQVAELIAEADPLLRREGLTRGTVGARLTELGRQERYLYPNTDAGRTRLIADLNAQMEAVRARMPEVFSTIPTSPMEVKRVPPAIEAGAPRGYAQGPNLDGTRPGAFYINLADTKIWPRWALPTLTYHESIPGHLWQVSTVLENRDIPLLHRNMAVTAYGEGWGLYAEQLADEVGAYRDFPAGRIGMLQSFLYRAARIVLDTGLHMKGWSREQAIQYFVEVVGLDPLAATNEVERYIVWPGQATAYKIGHTEFLRLRDQARTQLGSRFDIKSFHDAVLRNGDMPLEVLGTVVANWTRSRMA